MNPKEQRQNIQIQREALIKSLEKLYKRSFDNLSNLGLSESSVAKLTQLMLRSREGAINPLKEQVEAPVITHAPIQK